MSAQTVRHINRAAMLAAVAVAMTLIISLCFLIMEPTPPAPARVDPPRGLGELTRGLAADDKRLSETREAAEAAISELAEREAAVSLRGSHSAETPGAALQSPLRKPR